MEDEEPTGYIRFDKFLPVMTRVISERRYRPASEDVLLRAWKVLDTDNKGHLTQEELSKYLTEEGASFHTFPSIPTLLLLKLFRYVPLCSLIDSLQNRHLIP